MIVLLKNDFKYRYKMDLSNYAIHLTAAELEYELNIRGIFNLSTQRLRTTALRDQMNKENSGILSAPKRSEGLNVVEEVSKCKSIFENITECLISSNREYELPRCVSRLYHLESRLDRIIPVDETTKSDLVALSDCVYNALVQVCDCINRSKASRTTPQSQSDNLVEQQSVNVIDQPRPSNVDALNKSLREFSEKINEINFNNASDLEGAVGVDRSAETRESLIDLHSLTHEERTDIQNALGEIGNINPFRGTPKSNIGNVPYLNKTPVSIPLRQQSSGNIQPPLSDRTEQRHDYRHAYQHPNIYRDIRSSQIPRFGSETYSTNSRKSVPVHQWRISFSGERDGMHLYDFLSQLELFQRSEGVTDNAMMYSVIHLLTGRARLWYMSVYEQFRDWPQVANAMKKEFLPANYDYLLFSDINNRTQKSQESFSEFLTHMQALFKCLSIPLDESHKLYIVQRNLSPRYSMAIAPLELRSLQELSDACRRIDNASLHANRETFSLPFGNSRSELCVVQQPHNNVNSRQFGPIQPVRNPKSICWNCQTVGHSHRECNGPRNGIFCFGCGARGVRTPNCVRCRGNGPRDLAASAPAPNPDPQP